MLFSFRSCESFLPNFSRKNSLRGSISSLGSDERKTKTLSVNGPLPGWSGRDCSKWLRWLSSMKWLFPEWILLMNKIQDSRRNFSYSEGIQLLLFFSTISACFSQLLSKSLRKTLNRSAGIVLCDTMQDSYLWQRVLFPQSNFILLPFSLNRNNSNGLRCQKWQSKVFYRHNQYELVWEIGNGLVIYIVSKSTKVN